MTIIQPYESSIIDLGVIDWMVVDETYTDSNTFDQSYTSQVNTPIEIYNFQMVRTGVVDDYAHFKYTENWYDVDTWEMQVNRYRINSDKISIGGFIRYSIYGYEHIGLIERFEKVAGKGGKASEMWTVSGRGVEGILATRLATYNTGAETGFHTVSAVHGPDAMREYVDYNCIDPTKCGTPRVIEGLTLGDINPLTTAVSYSARFQPLTEILTDIAQQIGCCYYLKWSGSGLNFTFEVGSGEDVSASVKISPEFDNVESYRYLLTNAELKNVAYVGGVGTANSRDVDIIYTAPEPEGWDRRESFVEASDCLDAASMLSRGTSYLTTAGVQSVLEVDYVESNTFKYGEDFKIGDVIAVEFADVISTTAQIISVTEEFTQTAHKTSLRLGRAYPNLTTVFKNDRKLSSAQVRR